jgi:2-iminobutanoate/2-iminopropanoate deaminase
MRIMKEAIFPPDSPRPVGPYSPAILSGDFLFISGHVAFDPATGRLAGDTIEAQTRQTLTNIGLALQAAGLTFADVVKTTAFIAQADFFAPYNEVYRDFFSEPYPARSTVVTGLVLPGLLVEIEAIARRR